MDDLGQVLLMLAGGAPQPAQERVATALRRSLTLRIFAEDRLPSERALAEAFGYGLDDLEDFAVTALDASFLAQPERDWLVRELVRPGYERLRANA